MNTLRYVTIPSANYELGWRFTEAMPAEALVELSRLIPLDAMVARFAPHRTVTLPALGPQSWRDDTLPGPVDVALPALGLTIPHAEIFSRD